MIIVFDLRRNTRNKTQKRPLGGVPLFNCIAYKGSYKPRMRVLALKFNFLDLQLESGELENLFDNRFLTLMLMSLFFITSMRSKEKH